jgi:hypothetical protein
MRFIVLTSAGISEFSVHCIGIWETYTTYDMMGCAYQATNCIWRYFLWTTLTDTQATRNIFSHSNQSSSRDLERLILIVPLNSKREPRQFTETPPYLSQYPSSIKDPNNNNMRSSLQFVTSEHLVPRSLLSTNNNPIFNNRSSSCQSLHVR